MAQIQTNSTDVCLCVLNVFTDDFDQMSIMWAMREIQRNYGIMCI